MPNQTRVPLRLAICDDEALDRAQIAQMAQEILRAEEIRAEIFCIAAPRIQPREIVLPTASGQSRIHVSAIVYVEPWDRGVRLHLAHKNVEVRLPISQVTAMLPERQFAYCHRTLLANLAHVRYVRYCELELKNGERLPISKYRLAQFKSEFMKYLKA